MAVQLPLKLIKDLASVCGLLDAKQKNAAGVYHFAFVLLEIAQTAERRRFDDLSQTLRDLAKKVDPDTNPNSFTLRSATAELSHTARSLEVAAYQAPVTTDAPVFESPDNATPTANNTTLINPPHYKTHCGVECIEVASLFSFDIGNAIKYAWRAGSKGDLVTDLKKCAWYLNRAHENGEFFVFHNHSQATSKARVLFSRVITSGALPRLNQRLIISLLQGEHDQALQLINAELDDTTHVDKRRFDE